MAKKGEKPLVKDSAGTIRAAREMVAQLQSQASKTDEIDGSILDQLGAVLDVSVDEADDEESKMKSDASSVTDVTSAPSTTSIPDTSGLSTSSPSSSPSSSSSSSSSSSTPSSIKKEDDPAVSAPPADEDDSTTTAADDTSTTTEESAMNPEDESTIQKAEEPVAARPPRGANLIFDHVDELQSKLPEFIKALEGGSIAAAQKIAGDSSIGFDTMFGMAQHAILTEGGWVSENLTKLNAMASENALQKSANADPKLQKAITASSVPGIYLIRLAKLMLPVYAGLTNRIPADNPKGMGSTEATWKAQLGFGALAESSFFRVAEAAIGVNPPTSFLTFKAPYNDLAVNDNVTLKAMRASAGYADPLQIGVIKAMSALLRGQERVLLGGTNKAIDDPASVTITQGTPSESVLAAGSYVVSVTALSYEGWIAASTGGSAAIGETAYTAAAQFVLGAGSSIIATWPAVEGAVAYNVYITGSGGASGSAAKYHQTVKINKAVISTLPTSTNTPPTTDTSANETYGIEGLISWCERSTVYTNAIPDKQTIYDNAGGALTAGNGGITQFDHILADLWTTWHTAPSLMVMSPNMNATLVGKLQSLGSGNFYRIEVGAERNTVNGGMMVTGYVNKFAPFADGTPRMIDVIPHPYLPDGTVLFLSETIPYPMGNESRGFVREVLLPYTYFPLPSQVAGVNKIIYNFAVTMSETVECFNPGPQTALVGVDYTL